MVERSAGIIIFKNTSSGRKYLLLRSSRHGKDKPEFWDFPKGLLEKGESGIEAAKREVREETGITDLKIVSDFSAFGGPASGWKQTVRYFTRHDGKTALKFEVMFLAETKQEKITFSWEHDLYEWLPYQEAYERISRVEMKKALAAAEEFLESIRWNNS